MAESRKENQSTDFNLLIKEVLALRIDEQSSYLQGLGTDLHKMLLRKPVDETLQELDIRKHVKLPFSAAKFYHTERNLLVFLVGAYRCSLAIDDPFKYPANKLECHIRANNSIDVSSILDALENPTLLLIFKRYEALFKERYQKFKAMPDQKHLVFDLDETLLSRAEEKQINLPSLKWFHENNLVIHAFTAHIIHPGVIELMQFVFSMPNIRISFFSSGIEERNMNLVESLLIRALGIELYNQIKNEVTVFSRHDLNSRIWNSLKISEHVGSGEFLKNLNKITHPEQLANTILIEDSPSFSFPGQERNILIHEFCSVGPFERVHDFNFYHANHIFYIAGVLKWIFNNNQHHSLADALFDFQFVKNPGDQTTFAYPYNEVFQKKIQTHRYYRDGLALLQTLNPMLHYYGGENALHFFNTDLTMDEYHELDKQVKHAKTPSQVDCISSLPSSTRLSMFSFLNSGSIAAMRSVCKIWNYHCNTLPYNVKSPSL